MSSAASQTYSVDDEAAAAAEASHALAFIEAHLNEPLSVAAIADHCGASVFHFSRRFRARSGESVMAYVRGRRLDIAAAKLAFDGSISLAALALECGFETQAAFTRAFTRAFGQAPGAFGRNATPTTRRRRMRMAQPALQQRVERWGVTRIAGLSGRFEPSNLTEVSGLWQRMIPHLGFAGQRAGETIGVFRDRNVIAGRFEHLAGVRIDEDCTPPEAFEVWTIPEQTYLVYRQRLTDEALHVQVMAAQALIQTKLLPASGRCVIANAPDLQIYPAPFKLAGGWQDYCLPIED